MSTVRLVIGRILRFFQFIAALFKRALCFLKRREHIGELPFTVKSNAPVQPMESAPPQTGTWGNDFQWSEKTIVEDKIDQWRRSKETHPSQSSEPDFFNDMIPEIKRPKKAILKTKTSSSEQATAPKNLFAFAGEEIAPIGNVLGELDETAAWDDDISSTLHEHRLEKQKARHEEYDRRMQTRKGVYGQT